MDVIASFLAGHPVDRAEEFSPYAVLPSQWQDLAGARNDERTGEQSLVLAIIADALRVATSQCSSRRSVTERRRARDWILSQRPSPWSFRWCCSVLDLSPSYIASWLRDFIEAEGAEKKRALTWHRTPYDTERCHKVGENRAGRRAVA